MQMVQSINIRLGWWLRGYAQVFGFDYLDTLPLLQD
jgi:hypothetical protein